MTLPVFSDRLYPVSERKIEMKNRMRTIEFLNVTFKIKRNPEFKGNHQLCECSHLLGNTFDLGTTEAEMISEIENDKPQIKVVEISKIFVDRAETWAN